MPFSDLIGSDEGQAIRSAARSGGPFDDLVNGSSRQKTFDNIVKVPSQSVSSTKRIEGRSSGGFDPVMAGARSRGAAAGVVGAVGGTAANLAGVLDNLPAFLGGHQGQPEAIRALTEQGISALRPTDAALHPTFESAKSVAEASGTALKYGLASYMGGPLGVTALAGLEAVGGTPEQSEAALLSKLANYVGAEKAGQILQEQAQTPTGRALVSVATMGSLEAIGELLGTGVKALNKSDNVNAIVQKLSRRNDVTGATSRVASLGEPIEPNVVRTTELASAPVSPTVATLGTAGQDVEKAVKSVTREVPYTGQIGPENYINVASLSSDPATQQRLLATTEQAIRETDIALRKSSGRLLEPESHETVRARVAQDLGVDVADVIQRTADGQRLGRDDLLRIRTAMKNVQTDESDVLKKLATNDFASPEDRKIAELLRDKLAAERNGLWNTFSKQRTETGRDLAALRMTALDSTDPLVWLSRLQDIAKRPLSDAERSAVYRAADEHNVNLFVELGQRIKKNTPWEKFTTFVRAGLLTKPSTHIANIAGNTTMATLETVKDAPSAIFDNLISQVTGIRTKNFDVATLKASFEGAKSGLEEAKQIMRSGYSGAGKLDAFRETNYDSVLLNLYTKNIFRSMEAEDAVFRGMALQRSLAEQARVLAQSEGRVGSALAQRVQEIVAKPSDIMSVRAIADAETATFRNKGKLAEAGLAVRKSLGKAGDLIFPFVTTPANIATTTLEYSPLGVVPQLAELTKLLRGTQDYALQKSVVEGLGRATTGSAALALGYFLAKAGKATGFYPSDQRTRAQWQLNGKQEGSVLVDGTWYQANRIAPLGNLIAIGAAMHELSTGNADALTTAVGMATAPAATIMELPMISGGKDLIEALGSSGTPRAGEALGRFADRTIQSLVPAAALMRSTAYAVDPNVRDTKGGGMLAKLQSQIPYLSKGLPMRMDALGRPVTRDLGGIGEFFSPVGVKRDLTASDAVRAELERTNAVIEPISRSKNETDAAFVRRQEETGARIKRALEAVIQSTGYAKIGQMDTDKIRKVLGQDSVDTAKIPDTQIRARYQGYILDRVIGRVKAVSAKQLPRQITPRGQAIEQAIVR